MSDRPIPADWDAAHAMALRVGLKSSSSRRYIVVALPHRVVDGVRVPSAVPWIHKRSDSLDVARGHVRRFHMGSIIVDRVAGERVR